MVARTEGISYIRTHAQFDDVDAVIKLDGTFRCFDPTSRYFSGAVPSGIVMSEARDMCLWYGRELNGWHPLGFGDSQLLVGFHHNTPDNTLPIFVGGELQKPWSPIFRRFHKKNG